LPYVRNAARTSLPRWAIESGARRSQHQERRFITGVHSNMPRTACSSKHIRPLVGLAAAGVVGVSVLGFAGTAQAASVNPNPINSGNPTCATLVPGTTQFKLDAAGLRDGTYSDGTLTVTIANYHQSATPTPGSFDWSSNIGVDAVFVKAGSTQHNLYKYSPESTLPRSRS